MLYVFYFSHHISEQAFKNLKRFKLDKKNIKALQILEKIA